MNTSITVEEAVALMVNLDYIPVGYTLLEMTAAFIEQAEVDYENAQLDCLPETYVDSLKLHQARHTMAKCLLAQIESELRHPADSLLSISSDSFSVTRLTFDSVVYWASENHGIKISSKHTNTPPKESSSQRKLDNVSVTFAFLLEEFVNKTQNIKFKHSDGKLNCFAIAEHIAGVVSNNLPKDKKPINQDVQTIRKFISNAIKAKERYCLLISTVGKVW